MEFDEASMYVDINRKVQACRSLFKQIYAKHKDSDGKQKEMFEALLIKHKEATDSIIKELSDLVDYLTKQKKEIKHADPLEEDSPDSATEVIPPEPVMYLMNQPTQAPRINQTPFRVLYRILSAENGTRFAYNGYRTRYNQFKKHLEKILEDRSIDSTIRENFINAQLQLDINAKTVHEIKKNTNIAFGLVDKNKECRVGKTKMAYEYLLRLKDFINQIIPVDNPGAQPKQ